MTVDPFGVVWTLLIFIGVLVAIGRTLRWMGANLAGTRVAAPPRPLPEPPPFQYRRRSSAPDVPPAPPAPPAPAAAPVPVPAPAAPARRAPGERPLGGAKWTARAIVAAEIVAPPVALRPPDATLGPRTAF